MALLVQLAAVFTVAGLEFSGVSCRLIGRYMHGRVQWKKESETGK